MINGTDLYNVLTAVVPLYVAMILAYGSVKWWKIFTPDQCSGINRFVALFAVPLLSFHFISTNDPYAMNLRFIAADSLQKIMILLMLGIWTKVAKNGSLEWMITLFSLSTLPNTLVMGIPLLKAMGAKLLIMEQFPDTAGSIISFRVESDVMSLDGREPLQTDAEVGEDGKLHVTVRKSTSCRSVYSSHRSQGLSLTPRPSNLSNAEIYSIQSSKNPTPRGSNFNHADFFSMFARSPRQSNFAHSDIYSLHSSRGPTPRTSNFDEEHFRDMGNKVVAQSTNNGNSPRFGPPTYGNTAPVPMYTYGPRSQGSQGNGFELNPSVTQGNLSSNGGVYPGPNPGMLSPNVSRTVKKSPSDPRASKQRMMDDNKELHMFVWSSSASPVSEANHHVFGHGPDFALSDNTPNSYGKEVRTLPASPNVHTANGRKGLNEARQTYEEYVPERFSFGHKGMVQEEINHKEAPPPLASLSKFGSSSTVELNPKGHDDSKFTNMPPASVMTRLILIMVWRKLIRNPNTYSSLIGLTWSLITFRWKVEMPAILEQSIRILSDAGLGMAMFSLGLFMALQPRIIACGNSVAAFAMAVRFLTGPAVMAAASIAVGLRGVLLHVAIVQAALPQGIVPFVFAKEYNVHPDILSTAVIFGMLIALPITLVYYVLLGV
ncbi:hypothetical protein SUGI_0661210 [Cryptomeria japonica]|nr:hypothetical protein SUGI_0661210 [Cryptomeria japonica]